MRLGVWKMLCHVFQVISSSLNSANEPWLAILRWKSVVGYGRNVTRIWHDWRSTRIPWVLTCKCQAPVVFCLVLLEAIFRATWLATDVATVWHSLYMDFYVSLEVCFGPCIMGSLSTSCADPQFSVLLNHGVDHAVIGNRRVYVFLKLNDNLG